MKTVDCVDLEGKLVAVNAADVTFCPAVYGILIENQRVLLQQHASSGLWHPPGGRLPEGQAPDRAVRAFFRAATGMLPELGPLLSLEEHYRIDDEGRAWHLSVMYYALTRAPGAMATPGQPEEEQPAWIPLEALTREQMLLGYPAVQAYSKQLGRQRLQIS